MPGPADMEHFLGVWEGWASDCEGLQGDKHFSLGYHYTIVKTRLLFYIGSYDSGALLRCFVSKKANLIITNSGKHSSLLCHCDDYSFMLLYYYYITIILLL
jgi:hypothetical protein